MFFFKVSMPLFIFQMRSVKILQNMDVKNVVKANWKALNHRSKCFIFNNKETGTLMEQNK